MNEYTFLKRKAIYTLVSLFMFCANMSAQNILVKELPTYSQLPVSNLHHIVQDMEGYMWYGTDAGLCRDNGYQVDVFRNDLSNPNYWKSNRIIDLTVGKNDYIWVITTSGLYYLDKSDYKMHEIVHKDIPSTKLHFISCASDGSLWVTGGNKIIRLNTIGQVTRIYEAKNSGDGNKFLNQVYEDSKHDIWLFECRGAICKLDKKKDCFVRCDWPDDCEPHGGFVEDKANNCFWISTWGRGIVKYTPGGADGTKGHVDFQPCTFEGITVNSNKSKVVSMNSSVDKSIIWCCAMDGFYAYSIGRDGQLQPYNIDGLLPQGKKVFAPMYRDKYGNIWVASYSPHTFIISKRESDITRYAIPSVLARTGIETIADKIVFEGDYAWIKHLRLNLMLHNVKDDDVNIVVQSQKRDYDSNILVKRVGTEGVWTSSNNKVCLLQHNGMEVTCSDVVEMNSTVRSVYEDNNKRLWIGTDSSIWCYKIADRTCKKVFSNTGYVRCIRLSDKSKKLYFISDKLGFVEGNVDNGEQNILSKGIDERFEAMDVSPVGDICATTEIGGVYLYYVANGDIIRTSNASLESNDEITGVAFDSRSHLWIMTSQYVKEFNPNTKASRFIYASDNNVNLDYFCTLSKKGDMMCLGGAGGYCLVSSSSDIDDSQVNVVPVVTSYVVDGNKHVLLNSVKEITISSEDMNVSVNFSTFTHLKADRVRFAYCLHRKGSKPEKWVELPQGHNTAYFVGIPKGDYVLDVKATDAFGNWGEPVCALNVVRLPAWYESFLFHLCCIFILIGLVYLLLRVYYRNKMKNLEIQKLVKLAQEMREAEELRDSQQPITGKSDDEEVLEDDANENEGVSVEEPASEEPEEEHVRELTKSEQKFLADAKAMVEKHLSQAGYTTEQFASDMCMSRMNLYRKIQKITGQKPSEFVRMIRLQAAAKLLREDDISVAAVAEKVGFSSPSYFTKCFKDAFGVQPLQYHYYKK